MWQAQGLFRKGPLCEFFSWSTDSGNIPSGLSGESAFHTSHFILIDEIINSFSSFRAQLRSQKNVTSASILEWQVTRVALFSSAQITIPKRFAYAHINRDFSVMNGAAGKKSCRLPNIQDTCVMSKQCGVGLECLSTFLCRLTVCEECVVQPTAGAVQAPPAWLALAGVGGDAASVVALLGAKR